MSDEEKKAIDFFEKSFKKKTPPYWYDDTIANVEEKIKVILNLIEKQQKEIEELNRENTRQHELIGNIHQKWEDKIKAKIEVMNTNIVNAEKFDCDYIGQCRFAKYVLQSLLEKE